MHHYALTYRDFERQQKRRARAELALAIAAGVMFVTYVLVVL